MEGQVLYNISPSYFIWKLCDVQLKFIDIKKILEF